MTRHRFGGDLPAWTLALGASATSQSARPGYLTLAIPQVEVTFWSAATAGEQYDLQDLTGITVSNVTSDSAGVIPEFLGPDTTPDTWWMWADANGGAGPRQLILATDVGSSVNELRATVLSLITENDTNAALLASSLGVVSYDSGASSWPTRPADSRVYMWVGPTAPPVGGGYMQDGKDIWLNTVPVA